MYLFLTEYTLIVISGKYRGEKVMGIVIEGVMGRSPEGKIGRSREGNWRLPNGEMIDDGVLNEQLDDL